MDYRITNANQQGTPGSGLNGEFPSSTGLPPSRFGEELNSRSEGGVNSEMDEDVRPEVQQPVELGAAPEGHQPVELGAMPEGHQPMEFGAAPEGHQPVELGAAPEGHQPVELGAAPEGHQPVELGAAPEGHQPVELGATPEGHQPMEFGAASEGHQPVELGAAPEGHQPVELGATPDGHQPMEFGAAPEGHQPMEFGAVGGEIDEEYEEIYQKYLRMLEGQRMIQEEEDEITEEWMQIYLSLQDGSYMPGLPYYVKIDKRGLTNLPREAEGCMFPSSMVKPNLLSFWINTKEVSDNQMKQIFQVARVPRHDRYDSEIVAYIDSHNIGKEMERFRNEVIPSIVKDTLKKIAGTIEMEAAFSNKVLAGVLNEFYNQVHDPKDGLHYLHFVHLEVDSKDVNFSAYKKMMHVNLKEIVDFYFIGHLKYEVFPKESWQQDLTNITKESGSFSLEIITHRFRRDGAPILFIFQCPKTIATQICTSLGSIGVLIHCDVTSDRDIYIAKVAVQHIDSNKEFYGAQKRSPIGFIGFGIGSILSSEVSHGHRRNAFQIMLSPVFNTVPDENHGVLFNVRRISLVPKTLMVLSSDWKMKKPGLAYGLRCGGVGRECSAIVLPSTFCAKEYFALVHHLFLFILDACTRNLELFDPDCEMKGAPGGIHRTDDTPCCPECCELRIMNYLKDNCLKPVHHHRKHTIGIEDIVFANPPLLCQSLN